MTIQANAKVNLVLRIRGKRPDGFHDIETLMVPVSLADEIDVAVSEGSGVALTCADPGVPADATNLAWRAAELFQKHTGCGGRITIHLKKRIPHGAGLGGGSSDAAAVLNELNRIQNTRLDSVVLETMAAEIGSDIPFFIRCRPSLCKGRGEHLEPAQGKGQLPLLLIKPPFPIPTAWAYQGWTLCVLPHVEPEPVLGLVNDLERPVFQKYLLLPVIKSWLVRQPEVQAALMSGSGSTLFAVLKSPGCDLGARVRQEFGPDIWTCECTTLG